MASSSKVGSFTAFQIELTPEKKDHKYAPKLANVKVPTSKQKAHDTPIPDKNQEAKKGTSNPSTNTGSSNKKDAQ